MYTLGRAAFAASLGMLLVPPLLASSVAGADTGLAGPPGSSQVTTTGQVEQPAQSRDAAAQQAAAGEGGEQRLLIDTMRGRVIAVDHREGTVSVRTEDDTTINLTFAPEIVRNVQPGDTLSARLDVTHTGASAAERSRAAGASVAGDAPAPGAQQPSLEIGRQYVTGTVTSVDRERGSLQLESERGPLTLVFPPASLQNVQTGERMTVELGFARTAAPPDQSSRGAQPAGASQPMQAIGGGEAAAAGATGAAAAGGAALAGQAAGGSREEQAQAQRGRSDDPTKEYEQLSEAGPQQPEPPRRQTLRATVTSIDRTLGIVGLQPASGGQQAMLLQFAPAAVEDLKAGDTIVARYTWAAGEKAMPEQRGGVAGDAPARVPEGEPVTAEQLEAEMGQHQVSGTVSNLDKQSGRFDLTTGEATLRLQFDPQAVAALRDGQRIIVDMGFKREEPRG